MIRLSKRYWIRYSDAPANQSPISAFFASTLSALTTVVITTTTTDITVHN